MEVSKHLCIKFLGDFTGKIYSSGKAILTIIMDNVGVTCYMRIRIDMKFVKPIIDKCNNEDTKSNKFSSLRNGDILFVM